MPKHRTEEEANIALWEVIASHREYRLCGRWLVVHSDTAFATIAILDRWVVGIARDGWHSRPFWGRTS